MEAKELPKFVKNKFYWEIILASGLFITALAMGNVVEFIIYMLYFIIFLEVTRAIIGFIREQRVRLTPLIDAFIILVLREFIVTVVKINQKKDITFDMFLNSAINFQILVFSGVLMFLFFLRYLAYRTSPDHYRK
ncbi:MAG: hypothetical protein ACQERK_01150 [Campylobacterota bacterium]